MEEEAEKKRRRRTKESYETKKKKREEKNYYFFRSSCIENEDKSIISRVSFQRSIRKKDLQFLRVEIVKPCDVTMVMT